MEIESIGLVVALIAAYWATTSIESATSPTKAIVFLGTLFVSFMVTMAMMRAAAWIAGNMAGHQPVAPAPDVQFGVIFWIVVGALLVAFTAVRAAEFLTSRKFGAMPIVVIAVVLSALVRGVWMKSLPDYMASEVKAHPETQAPSAPPTQSDWDAAVAAWVKANQAFAFNPDNMAVMQQVLNEIDPGTGDIPTLLVTAHKIAVSRINATPAPPAGFVVDQPADAVYVNAADLDRAEQDRRDRVQRLQDAREFGREAGRAAADALRYE